MNEAVYRGTAGGCADIAPARRIRDVSRQVRVVAPVAREPGGWIPLRLLRFW
jgi:hypothetical protein